MYVSAIFFLLKIIRKSYAVNIHLFQFLLLRVHPRFGAFDGLEPLQHMDKGSTV